MSSAGLPSVRMRRRRGNGEQLSRGDHVLGGTTSSSVQPLNGRGGGTTSHQQEPFDHVTDTISSDQRGALSSDDNDNPNKPETPPPTPEQPQDLRAGEEPHHEVDHNDPTPAHEDSAPNATELANTSANGAGRTVLEGLLAPTSSVNGGRTSVLEELAPTSSAAPRRTVLEELAEWRASQNPETVAEVSRQLRELARQISPATVPYSAGERRHHTTHDVYVPVLHQEQHCSQEEVPPTGRVVAWEDEILRLRGFSSGHAKYWMAPSTSRSFPSDDEPTNNRNSEDKTKKPDERRTLEEVQGEKSEPSQTVEADDHHQFLPEEPMRLPHDPSQPRAMLLRGDTIPHVPHVPISFFPGRTARGAILRSSAEGRQQPPLAPGHEDEEDPLLASSTWELYHAEAHVPEGRSPESVGWGFHDRMMQVLAQAATRTLNSGAVWGRVTLIHDLRDPAQSLWTCEDTTSLFYPFLQSCRETYVLNSRLLQWKMTWAGSNRLRVGYGWDDGGENAEPEKNGEKNAGNGKTVEREETINGGNSISNQASARRGAVKIFPPPPASAVWNEAGINGRPVGV